uniref:Protein Wnt n=1 Tax=Trichobilharzia regenti TaxID=157069 RepID=A0AA85J0Q9_TRIRE|nr:unnamed protein product [Trichobilharzia regenti]
MLNSIMEVNKLMILAKFLLITIISLHQVYAQYAERLSNRIGSRIKFPRNYYLTKKAYLTSGLSMASPFNEKIVSDRIMSSDFSSPPPFFQKEKEIQRSAVNFHDKYYYDDASVISSQGSSSSSSSVMSPVSKENANSVLLNKKKMNQDGGINFRQHKEEDQYKEQIQKPMHSSLTKYSAKMRPLSHLPSFTSFTSSPPVIKDTLNRTLVDYSRQNRRQRQHKQKQQQQEHKQEQEEEKVTHQTNMNNPLLGSTNVSVSGSHDGEQNSQIKGRWWLDTIAKLLHSHPLTLSGNSRTLQNPIIEIYNEGDKPPSFTMDNNIIPPWNNIPEINYQNERQVLAYMNREMYNNPSVYGWRRQSYDPIAQSTAWIEHHVRQRIQRYKQWLSPKQWKQFLTHDSPTSTLMNNRENGINSPAKFNLALFEAAVVGVRRAVAECRYQFRHERWNCSQVPDDETALFGNILLKGIPQTAFVYSIINAGIVQSVAEACLNQIDNCPCNNRGRQEPYSDWQWQGCDHNIHYGRRFSRRLLDTMERGSHIRFEMNLHNNGVGRQLVLKNMERYCRCHGTSGSCTLRTCYRRTPRMRTLGNLLKHIYENDLVQVKLNSNRLRRIRNSDLDEHEKFLSVSNKIRPSYSADKAIKFTPYKNNFNQKLSTINTNYYTQQNNIRKVSKKSNLVIVPQLSASMKPYGKVDNFTNQSPHSSQLVYYESVNQKLFCDSHPSYHILGTKGRLCNSSSTGLNNCRHLCCGRGFITHHYYTMESCNCKFIWCCRVECQQCLVLKKVETCI